MGRRPLPPKGLTSVRLDVAARAFVAEWRAAASKGTTSSKQVIMNGLLGKLGAQREVWTLTRAELTSVVVHIIGGADQYEAAERKAAGMKRRTGRRTKAGQAQVRVSLRQFVEFCHDQHWLSSDVILPKESMFRSAKDDVREEASPKVRFTEQQWPDVLDAAQRRHMRARMAVALGLFCGRRASEIVRLQWKDVSFEKGELEFWNFKRGRPILMPMFPAIREELVRYRAWYEHRHGPVRPDWYVVPSRVRAEYFRGPNTRTALMRDSSIYPLDPAQQSSTETLNLDMRHVLAEFGYGPGEGTGTHTWRRSAAREFRNKYGIEATRALLDHKNIRTTEGYVGADNSFVLLRQTMSDTPPETPPTPDTMPDNVVQLRSGRRAG